MNTGDVAQLITDAGLDDRGCWAPGGGQIAFVSDRSGNEDIWVLDLLSGDLTQATDDPWRDSFPNWSPDGSMIAYSPDRPDAQGIWAISLAPDFEGQNITYLPHFTLKPAQWDTVMTLVNPWDQSLDLTLAAYANSGVYQGSTALTLAPGEGLSQSVATLFPQRFSDVGWLKIGASDRLPTGIMTFTFASTRATSSLPIQSDVGTFIVFPLIQNDQFWSSGFAICNGGDDAVQLQAELVAHGGSPLDSVGIDLGARSKWVGMVDMLFDVEIPETTCVRVESTGPVQGFALSFAPGNSQIVAVPGEMN